MKQDIEIKNQAKQTFKIVEHLSHGRSVELRNQYCAAAQCVSGSAHRKGTSPNVVEMDAQTLLKFSKGLQNWNQLCSVGAIRESGAKSNLVDLLSRVSKLISNFDEELNDGN